MVRIGITGGIGSGKSYVARLLRERGIPVYDTDSEAKRLMCTDVGIRKDLIGLLGKNVYQTDGTLNKPLVAGYLFADSRHAGRINSIIHPRVKADFLRWVATKADCAYVALESAILFESGFEDIVDVVVTVYAPRDVRIRRAVERDGTTEEKVRLRMAAQMEDEAKCRLSYYVIRNDGTEPLSPQLDDLLKTLEKN